MTRTLEISDALSLPLRVVTEKLAFLGRTGSGKTYAAKKLAELMHAAAAQFVVLDPVGVWYGLRLAADGKAAGLPIPVLGGLHGDIPLEPGAGALIANLVVDRGVSVVLDVSQFESDADKARFARAFADRFFFRMKAAPSAVHLFLEECQEFAPQNPAREEAGMLHAFTRLVKIGRNYGIGVSLISQRPQEVNKKVLNLTELLFAFQLTGPQERKTLQGWIAEKGIDEDIAGELPKLKVGAPHVWSPAWLQISKVVQIGRAATYDASSTPTVGAKAATRSLSPIDLEKLRTDMQATIEKAKAEDPRELRKEIGSLRATLRDQFASVEQEKRHKRERPAKEKRVEVPILKDAQVKRLEALVERIHALDERAHLAYEAQAKVVLAAASEIAATVRAKLASPPNLLPGPVVELVPGTQDKPRRITREEAAALGAVLPHDAIGAHLYRSDPLPRANAGAPRIEGDTLPKAQRAILVAIVQRADAGYPSTNVQAALLSGYSKSSSSFQNALGALRSAGLVAGPGSEIRATDAGIRVVGRAFEPLPSGKDLARLWLGHQALGRAERALLTAFLHHPGGLDKDRLSALSGYSVTSSSLQNALGKLRALELVHSVTPGVTSAHADFFA